MGIFGSKKKKQEEVVVPKAEIPDAYTMTPREVTDDYFVRHTVSFDKKLRFGQQIVITWDYLPGVTWDMIESIVPNCTCTAQVDLGKVGIRAVYTHEIQRDKFTEPLQIFKKVVTVYFKDGISRVSDGRGNLVWPAEKLQRSLVFGGPHVRP